MLVAVRRGISIPALGVFYILEIEMDFMRKCVTAFMLFTVAFLIGCNVEKERAEVRVVNAQTPSPRQADTGKPKEQDMIAYTRELVTQKVKEVFPKEDPSKIMSILDQYGVESYEQERERVQIAILKLSEGEMEKLHKNVRIAKEDYRDVLGYAEYPLEMQSETWNMDKQKAEEIRKKDRQQYLEWLNKNPE